MTQVGSLPTPTSDAAVAALAGTAYIVGGYDGQQALDTIIAWRPGGDPSSWGACPTVCAMPPSPPPTAAC